MSMAFSGTALGDELFGRLDGSELAQFTINQIIWRRFRR